VTVSSPHQLWTTFTEEGYQRLQDLLHRSPRDFGYDRSQWTSSPDILPHFRKGRVIVLRSFAIAQDDNFIQSDNFIQDDNFIRLTASRLGSGVFM